MEYILNIMEKIDLPTEARDAVTSLYGRLDPADVDAVKTKFFSPNNIDADVEKLAKKYNVNTFEMWLPLYIAFSERTLEIYKERGIDTSIFYDTMTDITIWAKVCKRDFGTWGLKESGWLSIHLRVLLFRLGRLQFEVIMFNFNSPYTRDGETINPGDPIINIHVPEGDGITDEKRRDSYKRAAAFFNLKWFTCGSWLLYPEHRNFLPPTSNIIGFMNDFDIIASRDDNGEGNLWRVFNRRNDGYDPKNLPRDTGLRKAYAEHWEKNGKTGEGTGIFLYRD